MHSLGPVIAFVVPRFFKKRMPHALNASISGDRLCHRVMVWLMMFLLLLLYIQDEAVLPNAMRVGVRFSRSSLFSLSFSLSLPLAACFSVTY